MLFFFLRLAETGFSACLLFCQAVFPAVLLCVFLPRLLSFCTACFGGGRPPFPPKKRSCCLKDCFPPFGLGLTYGIARCARTLVSHERFPLFLLSGFCSSFKPPTAEPLVSRSLLEVWGCHCSPCAPRSTAPSRTPCLSRDSHSAYSACCICVSKKFWRVRIAVSPSFNEGSQ